MRIAGAGISARCILIGILGLTLNTAQASLIPTESSTLYYKIGGGDSISRPANVSHIKIPLDASAEVNMGYNCGAFNPVLAIKNSLNNLKNSLYNIDQTILGAATSQLTSFAMYELSRINQGLYDMTNGQLLNAHNDLDVSLKSCQAMKSDISQGKNPYHDWLTISEGNDWKKQMSLGESDQVDINQAKSQVEQDNGNNGVPWVGGKDAGGENQPPIQVISDTVKAGYNSLLNRDVADLSNPTQTDANAHLVTTWVNPTAASAWATSVIGDKTITTCNNCTKGSTPGAGLLPSNEAQVTNITQKLQAILENPQSMNQDTLTAVSAPGVVINRQVIHSLQQLDSNDQSIMVNKLAQEVAMSKTLDQALLAKQLLLAGSRVPEIAANESAQKEIHSAVQELESDIQSLMFEADVRKKLVSNTVSALLDNDMQQNAQSVANPASANKPVPLLQDGAVPKSSLNTTK